MAERERHAPPRSRGQRRDRRVDVIDIDVIAVIDAINENDA
ncbi:hypothetical protein [Streptomyces sp. NPDC051776]